MRGEEDASVKATVFSAGEGSVAETIASKPAGPSRRPGASAGPPSAGTLIDRYVVLEELGAGAMGVVLAAYDPRLDRKVAIKLLRARSRHREDAAARLQREAQTLAQLTHPIVGGGHDVGVHEGQVYVAMEFVDGMTLGDWVVAEERDWRSVLEVFTAAGRGLAAAHRGGVVHRDFKPDNVMIGKDGRVRVMDFGLARADEEESRVSLSESDELEVTPANSRLTRTGAVLGTPAYMAPEQFTGLGSTALGDQFSFCVALHEALHGERPFLGETVGELAYRVTTGEIAHAEGSHGVPLWIDRLLRRGLSTDPQARFEDMQALLAALDSGEARRRRTRVLGALTLVAAVVVGTVSYQRWERAQRERACAQEGEAIAEVWNPQRRAAFEAGILGTEATGAPEVLAKTLPWIDRQAQDWRRTQSEVCRRAEVEQSWDASTRARANWCLEDARLQLDTLVHELSGADKTMLHKAVSAAANLKPLSPCANADALERGPEPPPEALRGRVLELRAKLARSSYLLRAGQAKAALELAREAREAAESVTWPPLSYAAANREGAALRRTAEYEEAERVNTELYLEAAADGVWHEAADAANELVLIVGYHRARYDEGAMWARHAQMAAKHAGDPLQLIEASSLNGLAVIFHKQGKFEDAARTHSEALAIHRRSLGAQHPTVGGSLNNLAMALARQGKYTEAIARWEEALELEIDALGEAHPTVARTLNNLAIVYGDRGMFDKSIELHRRGLAIKERSIGPDHPDVGDSLNNLAVALYETGDIDGAEKMWLRALDIRVKGLGPKHPNVATCLINLAAVSDRRGELDAARRKYEEALAIQREAHGDEHVSVGRTLGSLADLDSRQGRHEEALAGWTRALELVEKSLGPQHPSVAESRQSQGEALLRAGKVADAVSTLQIALTAIDGSEASAETKARIRLTLAKAQWEAGAGDEARGLAQAAIEMLPSDDESVAELRTQAQSWLDEHA